MKFMDTIPQRKRRPQESPLDDYEPYQKLRTMITGGKMKPFQQVGILVDQKDAKDLKMKFPWRTIADRLRFLVKDLGVEADYQIVKYETDTPGVWFVRVTFNPPVTKAKEKKVSGGTGK